jgi:hypothetical protein
MPPQSGPGGPPGDRPDQQTTRGARGHVIGQDIIARRQKIAGHAHLHLPQANEPDGLPCLHHPVPPCTCCRQRTLPCLEISNAAPDMVPYFRAHTGRVYGTAPALPAARPARLVVQPLPVPPCRRRAVHVEGLCRLPRQCQATTQAGRPCQNRAQPTSGFCWVHAPWSPQARSRAPDTLHVGRASPFLDGMLASGRMALPQLAVSRVTLLMGIGLLTWLLLLLLRQLGGGALSLLLV